MPVFLNNHIMTAISFILTFVAIYLLIGLIFSVFFLIKGLTQLDAATEGSGLFFKMLIFPGLLVFWPIIALKWKKAIQS